MCRQYLSRRRRYFRLSRSVVQAFRHRVYTYTRRMPIDLTPYAPSLYLVSNLCNFSFDRSRYHLNPERTHQRGHIFSPSTTCRTNLLFLKSHAIRVRIFFWTGSRRSSLKIDVYLYQDQKSQISGTIWFSS